MTTQKCFLMGAITLLSLFSASAQIFPLLQGQELLDSLAAQYKPATVLDYSDARDTLYSRIYQMDDSVSCVYSGHRLPLPPDTDPSTSLFLNGSGSGINCEHTYPQSKGAESGNPKSDMHHLFPTRSAVNAARGNDPFAEIPDEVASTWYYLDDISETLPGMAIERYSEHEAGYFEPREDHKGNAARSILYFYTMYKAQADAADPLFFSIQRETLCDWHFLDPADSLEIARTWLIASYQDGKPNPYVVDCTLAARTFCASTHGYCPEPPPPSAASETSAAPGLVLFPNPTVGEFSIHLPEGESSTYSLIISDIWGRPHVQGPWVPGTEVEVSELPSGIYFVALRTEGKVMVSRLVKEQ